MSSSTSSSEKNLSRLALAWGAGIALAWTVTVPIFAPEGGQAQSQLQENLVRAEDFLYSARDPDFVIVGSSKAARLEPEMFSRRTTILAFSGGSPLTGLRLLQARKRPPELVLVELNDTVIRGVDTQLLGLLGGKVKQSLLATIPALRQRFQPHALLGGLLQKRFSARSEIQDDAAPDSLIALQMETDREPPGRALLQDSLRELKDTILALEKGGVMVAFFDLPTDARVAQSDSNRFFRKEIREAFSPGEFLWIQEEPEADFQTSDGVHLLPQSARRFASRLEAKIQAITPNAQPLSSTSPPPPLNRPEKPAR